MAEVEAADDVDVAVPLFQGAEFRAEVVAEQVRVAASDPAAIPRLVAVLAAAVGARR